MFTNKFFRLSAIATLLLFLFSCSEIVGDGKVITENKNLSGFNKLEINIPAEVVYEVSENYLFEIKGEENILKEIETYIDADELVIDFKDNINYLYRPTQPIVIRIAAPLLQKVSVSGSAQFIAKQQMIGSHFSCKASGAGSIKIAHLTLDKLTVNASGSGAIEIQNIQTNKANCQLSGASRLKLDQLNCQELDLDASGAASTQVLSGNVATQSISLSGSADYEAPLLLSQTTKMKTSGASSANIQCSTQMEIQASGASSISYTGQANHQISTSGAATVQAVSTKDTIKSVQPAHTDSIPETGNF